MLGHMSFGVRDLAASGRFYDAVFAPLHWERVWDSPKGLGYGPAGGNDKVALFPHPAAARPLSAGPGFHLAFTAPSRSAVDDSYAAGMSLGGQCTGPPGLRPHYSPTYYAAYLYDPDGHKIEFVCQK